MKYIIDEDELIDLLETYHYANCLDQDGVDNWDWYMIGKDRWIADEGAWLKYIVNDFRYE